MFSKQKAFFDKSLVQPNQLWQRDLITSLQDTVLFREKYFPKEEYRLAISEQNIGLIGRNARESVWH